MKISKKMICLFSIFLMLSTALLTGTVNADYKEQPSNLIPTITVRGGLGIIIEIEGATEETSVAIVTDGAIIRFQTRHDYRNEIRIYVGIIDFGDFPALFDDFVLHISIGNDKYSYECKSFLFVYTFGFTPIDK